MQELNPEGYACDVLLSYDYKTPQKLAMEIESVCKTMFKSVFVFKYPAPKVEGWPNGPNYAFQSTANYIYHSIKRSWFWMEADMVPLNKDWLAMLIDEYNACDKPFMGPIIENIGHMNGCGFYPHDFPARCPIAMRSTSVAWDFTIKPEMIADCHNAS